MKMIVYKQLDPKPTTEPIYRPDGRESGQVWHRANLIKVGEVETWAQAKKLCIAPVVETVLRS